MEDLTCISLMVDSETVSMGRRPPERTNSSIGLPATHQSTKAVCCFASPILASPQDCAIMIGDLDRSTIKRRSIGARGPLIDRGINHLTIDLDRS